MSKTFAVESPRLKNRCRKSIRCSSELRCAVRFWSLESGFVFVFIIFFLLLCVLGLSPCTQRACGTGRPVEGILGRSPRPAPCGSRLWRARGCERWQNGFENITKRGAGSRCPVSQPENCEVERSPGCVGPDAQSERS